MSASDGMTAAIARVNGGDQPPLSRRLGKFALRAALVLAALYLMTVVAACTFQRRLLYFPDPTFRAPDASGPPMRVVRLTTRDNQRLVAWWLPPAAGKPVILYLGGNGESLIGGTDRYRLIAAENVGVLALAYRGYSGSSGHPTEAGLREDAETAYAWLAARYPAQRIVIHGHSLGPGVAVRLAAGHPVRALVLEAPFTSAVDVGAPEYPWLPVRLMMWDRFASRDWIGKVRSPMLIVHGDRDAVIPFRQGVELDRLANAPKTFVRIAGGHHDDLPQMGVYDDIWRFLGLPAVTTGPAAFTSP